MTYPETGWAACDDCLWTASGPSSDEAAHTHAVAHKHVVRHGTGIRPSLRKDTRWK